VFRADDKATQLRNSKEKNAADVFNSTAGIVTSMSPRAPQADGAHRRGRVALDELAEFTHAYPVSRRRSHGLNSAASIHRS
jgi:ATP-dependent exoDNAse (exonuclease V) alpha subunit